MHASITDSIGCLNDFIMPWILPNTEGIEWTLPNTVRIHLGQIQHLYIAVSCLQLACIRGKGMRANDLVLGHVVGLEHRTKEASGFATEAQQRLYFEIACDDFVIAKHATGNGAALGL